jgi:hypothetical protein
MTKAQTFAQQDEVVLLTLDAMGYTDDTRQARFPNCSAYMTDPGPRTSSSPASSRHTSRKSFGIEFRDPHMVNTEIPSTVSLVSLCSRFPKSTLIMILMDMMPGDLLRPTVLEATYSKVEGPWRYVDHRINQIDNASESTLGGPSDVLE